MTINYSKTSIFLIALLIWNIASSYFINYRDPGPNEGIRYYTYGALWIIWLAVSLLTVILYLIDSRKNKKGDFYSKPDVQTETKSKIADILSSFFLSVGSIILIHSVLFVTTRGFTISPVLSSEQWIPATAARELLLFLVLIPFYFYILNYSDKKIKEASLVLVFAYIVLFILYMVNGS